MATLTTLNAASPLDASDNTYLTFTDDITETLTRALDNTDADFGNMDTLTFDVEYSLRVANDDDTYDLSIRIVNGGTILAAADAGGTFQTVASGITNTTDTNSGATSFSYVNTSANKSTWDGASVELQQTYSKSKGGDGTAIRVDQVTFDGTYTTSTVTGDGSGTIPAARSTGSDNAYAGIVIEDAPVAYWRLGESSGTTAADEVGTNDGTYSGSPTLGATGALSGDSDTAVTFDGVDDYATVASAPSIAGTAFSVEAWFKSSSSGATPGVVYAEGISGGGNPLLAMFASSSTDLTFRLRDDSNTEYNVVDTTGDWVDGSWHHWVAVRDGSTLTLYKDGSQVDQITSVSTGTFSLDTATIAALDRNGFESLGAGSIDEVAIYDYALTSTQVSDHYNAGIDTGISGDGAIDSTVPTTTGSGKLGRTGSGAGTTALTTSSASGKISRDGSGAATVSTATSAATGEITVTGTGSISTGVITGSGSGDTFSEVTGTGSISTAVVTSSASGEITVTSSGSISAPATTSSASGKIGRSGDGSISTPLPTSSSSGVITKTGSGSTSTPAITGNGSGGIAGEVSGSGSISTATPTTNSTGEITKVGSGSASLTAVTSSSTGEITKTGSGAVNTPPVTSDGSGGLSGNISGSGSNSTSPVTSTSTGNIEKTGTGSATIATATSSAEGSTGGVISGSADNTTASVTSNSTGKLTRVGSASQFVSVPTTTVSAQVEKTGSGSATVSVFTSNSSGFVGRDGSGSATVANAESLASGNVVGINDATRRVETEGNSLTTVSSSSTENNYSPSNTLNRTSGGNGLNKVA